MIILEGIDWPSVIVSAIVTLVLSGILIPVCTKLVGRQMTKYFDAKDKEKEDNQKNKEAAEKLTRKEEKEELIKTVDEVVKSHTDPIDEDLKGIKDKLGKVADGTMDTLRDRILSSYYKCYEKGYRTQYDIDNVEHMNKDYLALNGNTFVAECMEKFKHIPTEKEYEIQLQREAEERKANKKKSGKSKNNKVRLSLAPGAEPVEPKKKEE